MESQAGVNRQNKYSKLLLNISLYSIPQPCPNPPSAETLQGLQEMQAAFPQLVCIRETTFKWHFNLPVPSKTSQCSSATILCVCVHIPAPSTKPDFCTSLLFIAEMQNSEKLLKTWKINLGILTPSSDSSAPAICVTQDAAKNGSRKWIRANNFFVQLQYAPKMDSVLYYIKGV